VLLKIHPRQDLLNYREVALGETAVVARKVVVVAAVLVEGTSVVVGAVEKGDRAFQTPS
jgi:hypothetical protein